ncbi:hypothetical protein QLQ12_00040 [Actinoplanes sp. NEAU-A12]|uniref:Uncharacterized protein n=1 Tax=Actinoplanes sandaracinus TaxID=3045177 RepID=A0ABT6WB81_9ACTN|nr:hypothetical protein [Actinoplanes sandaracinus]MDI6096995.1 hypothetical protein [Actinoplanes sandaracinus]
MVRERAGLCVTVGLTRVLDVILPGGSSWTHKGGRSCSGLGSLPLR